MEEHQTGQSQDVGVADLNVSKALFEILQALFQNHCPDSVDISVKSTRRTTSLTTASWFYIRVSANSRIELDLFKDTSCFPCLLELLEKMQGVEAESHLCIQNNVGGETCQQNLVIEGTSLVVQHETMKQKPTTDSSLYLRVHQSQSHMMSESQLVYKFLHVIKMFRPRMCLQFTMKIGENVCRSRYRGSAGINISPGLPGIVSESDFYLHKSSYRSESDYVKASFSTPYTITVRLGESEERLDITCLGVYIPVLPEAGRESLLTLTLLGPGWFPLDISDLSEQTLLGDLNLSKLGLRAVSTSDKSREISTGIQNCHWKLPVQTTNRHVPMEIFVVQLFLSITPAAGSQPTRTDFCFIQKHLAAIIERTCDKLSNIIRDTLHKSLQSWVEKSKTRMVVYKSIRSVSKAVRDIVAMSCDENFRHELYGQMQVNSTMELEQTIQDKLTAMSRKRHTGVWNNVLLGSQQDGTTSPDTPSQPESQLNEEPPKSNAEEINQVTRPENNETLHPHSVCVSDKHTRFVRDRLIDGHLKNQVIGIVGQDKGNKSISDQENTNRTPVININQNNAEDVSPFQQLAGDLMEAVDDICHTELHNTEMQEEPYGFYQTDQEIMSQLFYEEDKDTLYLEESTDLKSQQCQDDTIYHSVPYFIQSKNAGETSNRTTGNKHVLFSNSPNILPQETRLNKPEIALLQKDRTLKRSFSFPKDLQHIKERSSKFHRAFSGDRIVPQTVSTQQDYNDQYTNYTKASLANQICSSQPCRGKNISGARQWASFSQSFSINKTETICHWKPTEPSFEIDTRPNAAQSNSSEGETKGVDRKLGTYQSHWDKDLRETYDVISSCVDDCIDREILEDIGGHIKPCHSQSQVADNNIDINNNCSEKEVHEIRHDNHENERNTENKVTERLHTDSDDWFDAAVADIETWFN